jgi:hypothetical protein
MGEERQKAFQLCYVSQVFRAALVEDVAQPTGVEQKLSDRDLTRDIGIGIAR